MNFLWPSTKRKVRTKLRIASAHQIKYVSGCFGAFKAWSSKPVLSEAAPVAVPSKFYVLMFQSSDQYVMFLKNACLRAQRNVVIQDAFLH